MKKRIIALLLICFVAGPAFALTKAEVEPYVDQVVVVYLHTEEYDWFSPYKYDGKLLKIRNGEKGYHAEILRSDGDTLSLPVSSIKEIKLFEDVLKKQQEQKAMEKKIREEGWSPSFF